MLMKIKAGLHVDPRLIKRLFVSYADDEKKVKDYPNGGFQDEHIVICDGRHVETFAREFKAAAEEYVDALAERIAEAIKEPESEKPSTLKGIRYGAESKEPFEPFRPLGDIKATEEKPKEQSEGPDTLDYVGPAVS